jgi:hypothetical protein
METLEKNKLSPLEIAEKERNEIKEKVENFIYEVDLNADDVKILQSFILRDAPWKFTESLGILEIEKELQVAVETKTKIKTKALGIEAIYYYLSKVEGNGKSVKSTSFKATEDYIRVLRGISQAKEKIEENNEKLNRAEFVLAARREGIEPEQETGK